MTSSSTFGQKIVSLLAALAAFSVLAVGPAWWVAGTVGVSAVLLSAIAGLIPGVLLFVMLEVFPSSNSHSWIVLAGSGLRLVFSGGAALLMTLGAGWPMPTVLFSVGLFYAVGLAVEVWVLMPPVFGSPQKSG